MRRFQSNIVVPLGSGPTYAPTADEVALAGVAGISAWLEGAPAYYQRDRFQFLSWVDRLFERRFVSCGAVLPRIVASGVRSVLRFGAWGGGSGTGLGAIRAEDSTVTGGGYVSPLFDPTADWTIGFVARVPTAAESPAQNPGGVLLSGGGSTAPWSVLFNYNTNILSFRNTPTSSWIDIDTAIASSPGVTDGKFRTFIFGFRASDKRFGARINAAATYGGNVTAALSNEAGNGDVITGGRGPTGTDIPFVGEIGALFVVPGRFLAEPVGGLDTADLARLENRLVAIKTEVTPT